MQDAGIPRNRSLAKLILSSILLKWPSNGMPMIWPLFNRASRSSIRNALIDKRSTRLGPDDQGSFL